LASPSDPSILSLRGVTKTFTSGSSPGIRALDGISLSVAAGELVPIIGSNGAGKSTLLKVVAGLVQPEAGSIELDGRDITREPDDQRACRIGRLAQDPGDSTCAAMTVEENLALAERRGRPRGLRRAVPSSNRAWFEQRLAGLGLGLERRMDAMVATLSGGQRQALALLMATMGTPKVLLLDEHLASLDPNTADAVMSVTAALVADRGLATLMVTHSMAHAIRWGERLLMMHAGRIVADIAGDEKRRLSIEDLVRRFREATHEELGADRARLA
jgi:putative ABC transport system ATP-binding protein